ncbi:hypothetical protein [Salipiger pallidus]|uniref:hypothetical protein n=1 Tax=Salipiger pallidus TaxID=1775170 RepID=UPI00166A107F|nr:hypothetical protein [Salipiger pallidus]
MTSIKTIASILITKTRSFWLAAPAASNPTPCWGSNHTASQQTTRHAVLLHHGPHRKPVTFPDILRTKGCAKTQRFLLPAKRTVFERS